MYFIAAYLSLVVINGIITFMLTPGRWLETGQFWDGFFNPTYWPALVLRTGICAMMATAFMMLAVQRADADARPRLTRYLGWWLVGGALVSYAGYRWWEASLPESVLAIFRGDAPLLESLAATRSVTLWALAAALILGATLFIAVPRAGRTTAAIAVALAAFLFFGSYERLREGVRKPFLIHSHMFSNGLKVDDIETVNAKGMVAHSGWVAARVDEGPAAIGQQIFRAQCASCHTLDGYQSIREALPTVADMLAVTEAQASAEAFAAECATCHRDDFTAEDVRGMLPSPDEIRDDPEMIRDLNHGMITATLQRLRDLGDFYVNSDRSTMIATHEADVPYMPPFVGTDEDLEALAAYLASLDAPSGPSADRVAQKGGE